jgi:nucleotide-binding universal stress UspA family protein
VNDPGNTNWRKEMASEIKMLVLVDGSERSVKTIDYICRMKPFFKNKLVLYHVFTGVPEGFWDLEKEALNLATVNQLRVWEVQKKIEIREFMKKAKSALMDAGFPEDVIEEKIYPRNKGIARDILAEAQEGYAAVILRRRGMGTIESVVMGSVANKLISKLSFLPVIIAGQRPAGDKILIGIDGSDHSIRATEFVGKILGGYGFSVELLHVIRAFSGLAPESPELLMPGEYVDNHQKKMAETFASLRQKLIGFGFEDQKITEKIISGAFSRAGAIVEEAEAQGCDTIVVGRKGISSVQEFFIGRVSNKIIYTGRKTTVWIL